MKCKDCMKDRAKQILNQWHYKHYEDYIPSPGRIEGAMYQDLIDRYTSALTQSYREGLLKAAEIVKSFGELKKLLSVLGNSLTDEIASAIRKEIESKSGK